MQRFVPACWTVDCVSRGPKLALSLPAVALLMIELDPTTPPPQAESTQLRCTPGLRRYVLGALSIGPHLPYQAVMTSGRGPTHQTPSAYPRRLAPTPAHSRRGYCWRRAAPRPTLRNSARLGRCRMVAGTEVVQAHRFVCSARAAVGDIALAIHCQLLGAYLHFVVRWCAAAAGDCNARAALSVVSYCRPRCVRCAAASPDAETERTEEHTALPRAIQRLAASCLCSPLLAFLPRCRLQTCGLYAPFRRPVRSSVSLAAPWQHWRWSLPDGAALVAKRHAAVSNHEVSRK